MKKTHLFYSLLSIVSLSVQTNAMELDPETVKTPQSVRITKLLDAVPFAKLPAEAIAVTGNNNRLPIMAVAEASLSFTKKELELVVENLVKNNPAVAEAIKNDPAFKDELIRNGANKPMPIFIPGSFLADKKPDSIVMYIGTGASDSSSGFKLSETEGSQVTGTTFMSDTEKDPLFITPPKQMFVATEGFCKETNKAIRTLETEFRTKEQETEDGRRVIGDQFGITSGWSGGKPLMDRENRSLSTRPR